MYTRSYKDTEQAMLPPHYDGIAFGEVAQPPENLPKDTEPASASPVEGVFSRLLGSELFHGIKMPSIGAEEILLIVAAAFLFFSKDGDKECAILLVILLFLA